METKDILYQAISEIIRKNRRDLEDPAIPSEERKAFLQSAAELDRNVAFGDVLSRIAEDAHTFITTQARDMDAIHAHRAILIVTSTLKEQVHVLATTFENERQEAERKVENPQALI